MLTFTDGGGEDQPEDVRSVGAEGHADAEFVGARGDAVRDDAVQADGGEGQREDREDAEQRGHQALLSILWDW